MDLLIDTHTFIWFLEGDSQLSPTATAHIKNPENYCAISIASLWEASIKININKLSLKIAPSMLEEYLIKTDIAILPISLKQLGVLETLPLHHRDPFDRLIISQAISNNFSVITKDDSFKLYPIEILW
jgi:PIN domain nuclease of toxin-antitoxin system